MDISCTCNGHNYMNIVKAIFAYPFGRPKDGWLGQISKNMNAQYGT